MLTVNLFGILNLGHWDLFEFWCLEFVIYRTYLMLNLLYFRKLTFKASLFNYSPRLQLYRSRTV
jgi:hypothetical protein